MCETDFRSKRYDADGEGPILSATRNDALDAIVDECPENRRKDLVFMQNGYLDDFLESKGLLDNTQVLLYMSVAARDVDPVSAIWIENSLFLPGISLAYLPSFSAVPSD